MKVYAVSDFVKQQHGRLMLTVYSLDGKHVSSVSKDVCIPANTSTLILEQSVEKILKSQPRENVVISMQIITDSGTTYQANTFLSLQKDLRLQHVTPQIDVETYDDGCDVILKSDCFVRGISLSVNDVDCRLSDNYIDLLPGIPAHVHITTRLTADELRKKLKLISLNDIK